MHRSQQKPSWREREAERKRIAEDEERRKKTEVTETNFPVFTSTKQPTKAISGSKYASLAQNWATDEAQERQMEEYRKSRENAERRQYESFYHVRASYRSDYDRGSRYDDYEEYDAPAPAPVAAGSGGLALPDDGGGWTEVKNKVRKPKRDLSVAEMDERDRRLQAEEDDIEFNAHLYESGRHDHDKV
jgi:hypothetical protein